MDAETCIDLLLEKHCQVPSFPFHDWTINAVSFYALIRLWDELFKTAAGQLSSTYVDNYKIEMDVNSVIYNVILPDKSRCISVYPEKEGGTFYVITKRQDDDFSPDKIHLGYWPDRSQLGFATDLQRDRLIACFEIIRHYVHAEIPSLEAGDALHLEYVERYKHYFGFPDYDPFAPTNYDDHDEDEEG